MNKNLSVHLQNFPDIAFLDEEQELVTDMDMVRQICSAALFIRDSLNLRVRLPLNRLTIVGKGADKMLQYQDIISDEVNVKNIITAQKIGDLAELKLQINFKKVGSRLGNKMKAITIAAKQGDWKKVADNKIFIVDEELIGDEFEIKLVTKNQNNIAVLPSNDCLIELDINVTKELEEEGLARDVIRVVQQNRKDADFNVSDHIKIFVTSDNQKILEAIKVYQNYIKEQTLADEIVFDSDLGRGHIFENKIGDVLVKMTLVNYSY